MEFKYKAYNNKGVLCTGYIESKDNTTAYKDLRKQFKNIKSIHKSVPIFNKKCAFKDKDFVIFFSLFSTLADEGMTSGVCLQNMSNNYKGKQQQALNEMLNYVMQGNSLTDAMKKAHFPELVSGILEAGELTGRLPEAMDNIVQIYETQSVGLGKLYFALLMPALSTLISLIMSLLMGNLILPQYAEVAGGIENLSNLSRGFINFTQFIVKWYLLPILLPIGVLASAIIFFKKTNPIVIDKLLLTNKIIGQFLVTSLSLKFAMVYASLFTAGIMPDDAFICMEKAITKNKVYRKMFSDGVKLLKTGTPVSDTLNPIAVSPFIILAIKTGEETGRIDVSLNKITGFMRKDLDKKITLTTTLLGIVALLFTGLLVGIIAMASVDTMSSIGG